MPDRDMNEIVPGWDAMVEAHKQKYESTDEEKEAWWRRFVTAHPECDIIVLRRRSFDEMHDQVLGNLLLAKGSANTRPTPFDRVVAWWKRLWRRTAP